MKLTMAACRLLMALFLLSAWQCSFAQKIDKYGYKVVKEMRVKNGNNPHIVTYRFSYNGTELSTMECSGYWNGDGYKYVRNGNKIHRYEYIDNKLYKFNYCDYWLNSDGVVEKKEEWSCDADGSGGAIRNTYEYVYINESFTKLPLIYKISEKKEARNNTNSKWVDQDGGDMRIWEYDYTCGYMNQRQCEWRRDGKFVVDRWKRNGYILYDGYPNMDSELFHGTRGGQRGYTYSEKLNDTNVDFFYDYDCLIDENDAIFRTEWCSRRSNNLLRYVKTGDERSNRIDKKYEYTYDEQGNIVRVDVFSKFAADGKPKFIQRIYLEYLY